MFRTQNIFVVSKAPSWWVKIGDFGLTKRIENDLTALRTYVGTQHFQAPEILGYIDEESSEYTNAVDLWSLGCVTYELLTRVVPFATARSLSLYCKGKTPFPKEPLVAQGVSNTAVNFIEGLMRPNPLERLTVDTAIEDPWLTQPASSPEPGSGREDLSQLLLEAGCLKQNEDLKDKLIFAAAAGRHNLVKLLLEEPEVNVNCVDNDC